MNLLLQAGHWNFPLSVKQIDCLVKLKHFLYNCPAESFSYIRVVGKPANCKMKYQIVIKRTGLNILIKSAYYEMIFILVSYVFIAAYSYYSVLASFGEVPGNDYLYELARKRNLEIKRVFFVIYCCLGY